jgi:hypothetical protein
LIPVAAAGAVPDCLHVAGHELPNLSSATSIVLSPFPGHSPDVIRGPLVIGASGGSMP